MSAVEVVPLIDESSVNVCQLCGLPIRWGEAPVRSLNVASSGRRLHVETCKGAPAELIDQARAGVRAALRRPA